MLLRIVHEQELPVHSFVKSMSSKQQHCIVDKWLMSFNIAPVFLRNLSTCFILAMTSWIQGQINFLKIWIHAHISLRDVIKTRLYILISWTGSGHHDYWFISCFLLYHPLTYIHLPCWDTSQSKLVFVVPWTNDPSIQSWALLLYPLRSLLPPKHLLVYNQRVFASVVLKPQITRHLCYFTLRQPWTFLCWSQSQSIVNILDYVRHSVSIFQTFLHLLRCGITGFFTRQILFNMIRLKNLWITPIILNNLIYSPITLSTIVGRWLHSHRTT